MCSLKLIQWDWSIRSSESWWGDSGVCEVGYGDYEVGGVIQVIVVIPMLGSGLGTFR